MLTGIEHRNALSEAAAASPGITSGSKLPAVVRYEIPRVYPERNLVAAPQDGYANISPAHRRRCACRPVSPTLESPLADAMTFPTICVA